MNDSNRKSTNEKLSYGDTIYLLPLFIRTFLEGMSIAKNDFYEDVNRHLSDRLEEAFRQLLDISKKISEGSRRELSVLTQLHKTVIIGSGGRLVDVLEKIEKIVQALEKYPHLNNQDIKHLNEVLSSYENLISETNNTGLERRTLNRMLKCDSEPTVKPFGVKIVIEVLAGYLNNDNNRRYFISEVLTNIDSVKSHFFTYRGMAVDFHSIDYVSDKVLSLRDCSPAEYFSALSDVVDVISKHFRATLTESDPNANLRPKREVDYWESDTEFNVAAMEFINERMCLNKIIKSDVKDNAQMYLQIIDSAHKLFLKEWKKRDKDERTDVMYMALLQELVIHSLHCQERIHASLCQSFNQWLQE